MAAESAADAPDWLGACRRSAGAIREMLDDRPTIAERVKETGTRGEGGDRTLQIDEAAEDVVFAELDELYAAGARFTAVSEERGVVEFGSRRRARRDRPDRRLAQRQARAAAPRALDRGRRRPDAWPTSCSASYRTSGPTRSGWRGAAGARSSTACRWTRRSASAATARRQARGARRRVRRPALGRQSADALARPRTGCARSGRSRCRSARSPPPASTRWRR